ncbi:MAG: HAMP domain-containing methyl-accepting chemotaxis protein [Candidatus Omnitrophota bacterium]
MRITVGQKLMGGVIVKLTIMVIIIAAAIIGIKRIDYSLNFIQEKTWPAADAIMEMRISFLQVAYAHSMIMEGEIEQARTFIEIAHKNFEECLSRLKNTGLANAQEIAELEDIDKQLDKGIVGMIAAYENGPDQVTDMAKMAKSEIVMNSKAMEEFDSAVESMGAIFESLEAQMMAKQEEAHKAADNTTQTTYNSVVIFGLIGIALGLTIGTFLSRLITRPLFIVNKRINEIAGAAGDLTAEVQVASDDEIGDLAKAFNGMLSGLKGMVVQIFSVSERISSSSQELSSSAQEMNATTEEVSTTVQQIAKGTETQANKVEETQKVMEQMAASVNQVSKSAQDAASQSARSLETAQQIGQLTRKEGRDRMIGIAKSITESSHMVRKLGERSDQIGDIVAVITNIADQTNLLALNAAIEAARAGEYGRGFAVVAEEVRKLAEASAKSADQIGKLIKDVQKDTTQAVSGIEGLVKDADMVVVASEKTGEGILDIIKNAESVATMIEQVSAASQEQAAGATQASKSVSDIASVAEETASATEEASASTEEMTASMEQMAASAQELADMGLTLNSMVAKFKIGDAAQSQAAAARDMRSGDGSRISKLREKADAMKKKMTELRHKKQG